MTEDKGVKFDDEKPMIELFPFARVARANYGPITEAVGECLGSLQRFSAGHAVGMAATCALQRDLETAAVRLAAAVHGHVIGGAYAPTVRRGEWLWAELTAPVLQYGRFKYAAWNWAKGLAPSRLIAAAYRHLEAPLVTDPETGFTHAQHALCCMLFLVATDVDLLLEAEERLMAERRERFKPLDRDELDGSALNAGPRTSR